jgi:hypothetical protein
MSIQLVGPAVIEINNEATEVVTDEVYGRSLYGLEILRRGVAEGRCLLRACWSGASSLRPCCGRPIGCRSKDMQEAQAHL